MANIVTLLWGLLAGLRGTIAQAAAPAWARRTRTDRVAPARTHSDRKPNEKHQAPIPDPAAIERALAELLSLFAQWQAGTLPPQPDSAPRYVAHPSWHPVWLRRRPAPAAKPAPRSTPTRTRQPQPAPARPLPQATRSPAPIPRPHRALGPADLLACPRAFLPGRALPRTAIRACRGQAPTPPTP